MNDKRSKETNDICIPADFDIAVNVMPCEKISDKYGNQQLFFIPEFEIHRKYIRLDENEEATGEEDDRLTIFIIDRQTQFAPVILKLSEVDAFRLGQNLISAAFDRVVGTDSGNTI